MTSRKIRHLKSWNSVSNIFIVATILNINFFFQKKNLPTRVSNGLDPDQDWHSVGPDLSPNCLHRISAEDEVAASKERSNFSGKFWISNKLLINS